MTKICPSCGERNKENAIICFSCMEDISNIFPVQETENKKQAVIIFKGKKYIIENSCIIGRTEYLSENLSEYKTVSRKHIKISFDKDTNQWIIEDLNSTNGTYVNDKKITKPQPLNNKDKISLGRSIEMIFKQY